MDLDGTLVVSGDTHLENRLVVSGGVVLDSTLNVNDNFDINNGKFTVEAGTGNTFYREPSMSAVIWIWMELWM